MPRHVAVFTSSRADAWPLLPVLAEMAAREDLAVFVIAAGTHLDARRGSTLDDLAGFDVEVADAPVTGDRPRDMVTASGRILAEVARILDARTPDLMLVLGDRWELLAAVQAAVLIGVPVAHLHGGEVTLGALDERIRHAVTKLADIHLCATDEYARRLRQLGEEAWRVHVTGAPSLDRFRELEPNGIEDLEAGLGVRLARPLGLVTYHPPTVGNHDVRREAEAVLECAADKLGSVVVTLPGAERGSEAVIGAIDKAARGNDHLHPSPSLGALYAAALACADVMIGNSSSGVIEAASFRLPVVNVGDRQEGRVMPPNVVQATTEPSSLSRAIDDALNPAFRASLADLVNPYGDGRAAARIAEVLAAADIDRLARKVFVDMEGAP